MERIYTSKKHIIREIPRVLLIACNSTLFLCRHEDTISFLFQRGTFWLTDYNKFL